MPVEKTLLLGKVDIEDLLKRLRPSTSCKLLCWQLSFILHCFLLCEMRDCDNNGFLKVVADVR